MTTPKKIKAPTKASRILAIVQRNPSITQPDIEKALGMKVSSSECSNARKKYQKGQGATLSESNGEEEYPVQDRRALAKDMLMAQFEILRRLVMEL